MPNDTGTHQRWWYGSGFCAECFKKEKTNARKKVRVIHAAPVVFEVLSTLSLYPKWKQECVICAERSRQLHFHGTTKFQKKHFSRRRLIL